MRWLFWAALVAEKQGNKIGCYGIQGMPAAPCCGLCCLMIFFIPLALF